MTSPLRYVGGKRTIWPQIRGYFPKRFNTYAEPFFGGGSIYLALVAEGYMSALRWALLSDALAPLMTFWTEVRDEPHALLDVYRAFVVGHEQAPNRLYDQTRLLWNNGHRSAASFFYFNRAGFNGVWRENAKGEYNVPRGSKIDISIDEANLFEVSRALQGTQLAALDFRAVCARATRRGALLYIDPPYDQTFEKYTGKGFTREDREDLVWHLRQHVAAGYDFVANDADTPYVRELYQGFHIAPVVQRVNVNSDGKGRGAVSDLVISSREALS